MMVIFVSHFLSRMSFHEMMTNFSRSRARILMSPLTNTPDNRFIISTEPLKALQFSLSIKRSLVYMFIYLAVHSLSPLIQKTFFCTFCVMYE